MSLYTALHVDADTEYERDVQGVDLGRLRVTSGGREVINVGSHSPDEIQRMARELDSLAESMRLARIASIEVAA